MSKTNKIHTFGDNNIQLQNITANDINIITGKEEDTEIASEKKAITEHIVVALKLLGDLFEKKENKPSEKKTLSDDFEGICWNDLLEAIEVGNCVLFIGQDISTDSAGNSLHELFFKEISEKSSLNRKIEYDEKDSFFMPGKDRQIETKALSFYSKEEKFKKQNAIANDILLKLAPIPFSLIIPVCPDDTMHQIYEKYNKKHLFKFYKPDEKQEIKEPTKETPVIYNLLGNAADNGKYIYTHKQFYKYINEEQLVTLPLEIENKIKNVPQYLFIGIDFNRWYNRLLLFTMSLFKGSDAYTFSEKKINKFTQNFIDKQFNMINIESNFSNFVNVLIQKCEDKGISTPLHHTFIENTKIDITRIKDKALKANSFTELSSIIEEITTIADKIDILLKD